MFIEVLELTLLVSDDPFAIKHIFASLSPFDDELEEETSLSCQAM